VARVTTTVGHDFERARFVIVLPFLSRHLSQAAVSCPAVPFLEAVLHLPSSVTVVQDGVKKPVGDRAEDGILGLERGLQVADGELQEKGHLFLPEATLAFQTRASIVGGHALREGLDVGVRVFQGPEQGLLVGAGQGGTDREEPENGQGDAGSPLGHARGVLGRAPARPVLRVLEIVVAHAFCDGAGEAVEVEGGSQLGDGWQGLLLLLECAR